MKVYIGLMKRYWECTVLGGTVLVIVCILGWSFFSNQDNDDFAGGGKVALSHDNILSENAFAFLKPQKLTEETPGNNPFLLPLPAPVPPKPKSQPKPVEEKKVEPVPVIKPPEPVVELPKAPEKPKPVQNFVQGSLTFTYQRLNPSGKAIAILMAEKKGSPAQTLTMGVGDIQLGFRLLAISEEAVTVLDASGRRYNISLGYNRILWMK